MGVKTSIEWADSTLNLQMGCDGCELWNGAVKRCYAGVMTERYGGKSPGWPTVFTKPKTYLERLDAAERWPDLTGTDRPEKPWLNGRPRMIFLNDIGDTFTESLPLNWLEPVFPRMEAMRVIWMCLTKRPGRMAEIARACGFPKNFWLMTSVTDYSTMGRVQKLLEIPGDYVRVVSYEPALGLVDFRWESSGNGPFLDGIIAGGESGPGARRCDLAWLRSARDQCKAADVAFFLKQLGSKPTDADGWVDIKLNSPKGSDPSEWPTDLRDCRELPGVRP
jgi:protein gp37